ncbi:hypothetical protein BGZ93_001729 [Podila epicladia]|nr:hypothetical protein BGZ92_008525 [Podila epicladia]KAG0097886.1 hypothetical protein BGZ93_001729 [Podila epicladia]
MPHMLQRQLSRTLCDEYTNIFDDSLSQSHAQAPVLVSVSEVSSRSVSQCFPEEASALLLPPSPASLMAMETISWSPSSVATPGFSPSSETDDSILLDSLSSPASPLFPVLQMSPFVEVVAPVASTTATVAEGSVSCSPEMLFAEDDDFFHNSFYRSLDQGLLQAPQVPIYPHSQEQASSSLDISCITISDTDQKSALSKRALNLATAAPSEIFNVTMELLSVDPLQLSQATTTSASSSSSTSTQDTEMAIFVATLESQIEHSQATDPAEFDFDFSETSTLSDVSDDSDGDYVMASSVNNTNNNNNNKRKPSSSSKATKRRPRQDTKYKRSRPTVQKTPKVYPPRKPRTKATESDSNTNMSAVIKTTVSDTATSGSPSSSSKLFGQNSRIILSHPAGGFMCDQCPGERFGRVHDLKRHQDSKHFVMTWPCDFCHRPFVRRDALLRHYVVKSARHDGIHPTESESHRLYEAKARAKARC